MYCCHSNNGVFWQDCLTEPNSVQARANPEFFFLQYWLPMKAIGPTQSCCLPITGVGY